MLDWVYTSVLGLQESFPFTAVTQALTRALKGFFLWFKPAIWWTSINPNPVYALANRRFFPRFSSSGRKMSAFKQFLLYVKITRSTNLWSVCRRKLELSTYLNTEILQPHKLSQYTLATRLSSFEFRILLSIR